MGQTHGKEENTHYPDHAAANNLHQQPHDHGHPHIHSPTKTTNYNNNAIDHAVNDQRKHSVPRYVDVRDTAGGQKGKDENMVPTVFRWTHGGRNVYIAGTFNQWRENIPMTKSGDDFIAILNVSIGKHEYKFIVDNEWKFDPTAPTVQNGGNVNNVLEVTEPAKSQETEELGTTPVNNSFSKDVKNTYTCPETKFEENKKNPPLLPPHLRYTPLNSPMRKGEHDPSILPVPLHVTLNHIYFTRESEGVLQLAVTQRYKSKFSTVVLYKPTHSTTATSSSSSSDVYKVQDSPMAEAM